MNVRNFKIFFIIGVLLMGWLTGWGFRKELTVQDANVDGNLTDFPVYVKIDADADFHEARADGHDIRFTQSDGTILLKYEREYWTGGNGSAATAHFWVKVPSILASGGATIYIYYDKSDASDGEDAVNVWDDDFIGVWHLKESGYPYLDSTSNNNDITVGEILEQINAKIYKGQDFSPNDYCSAPDSVSLDSILSGATFSCWVKFNVTTGQRLFAKWDGSDAWILELSADGKYKCWIDTAGGIENANTTDGVEADVWHYITGTYDNTNIKLYVDRILKDTHVHSSPGNITTNNDPLLVATTGSTMWLDGILDEMRVSKIDRGIDWVKFEYHNMQEADQELTWGAEEEKVGEYTLTADAGSYVLSGQLTGLLYGRLISIGTDSYSLSGQTVSLLRDGLIDIGIGSYVLTGQDIAFLKGRILIAETGNYLTTGQIADLLRDAKIDIGVGNYALSGQAASLLKTSILPMGAGSYAVVGQDAGIYYGRMISIGSGSYALSGQLVDLLKDSIIIIGTDAYVLTGQDVALDYSAIIEGIIFDVLPRERIFDIEPRERIFDVRRKI